MKVNVYGTEGNRTWEFENGVIVDEANFCGFEVYTDDREKYLGSVVCADSNDFEACVADLNNGIDPITGLWEDGNGKTCTLDGWDNQEED